MDDSGFFGSDAPSEAHYPEPPPPEAAPPRPKKTAKAKPASKAPEPHEQPDCRSPEFSDDALALRFSYRSANALRYVSVWGKWLEWDGKVWKDDETIRVYDLVRGMCRAASAECDKGNVAVAVASAKTVAAVERMARSDRRHAATVDQWDADPWLLNTPDGVVDLRTGTMRSHHPDDYQTKVTMAAPGGECPIWHQFLAKITGEDGGLIDFLQRVAGYTLTGITREHALFFGYGTGGNGKGVFLNTLTGILGGYAKVAPMETFAASHTDRHPTELAMLRGARLVTAQETEEGRAWAEAKIKALTGGDPVTARFMRMDYFTFIPQFKLFIAGNHKPGLRGVDESIRRRFNLIPFTVTIPKEERDPELMEKLKNEWPGILAWAIEGCLHWQKVGLMPPASVIAATDEYLESEDTLALWIAERCKRNGYGGTETGELFADWKAWALAAGEEPGSTKRFSQALEKRGFREGKAANNRSTFEGLALNNVKAARTEPAHERD